MRKVAVWVSGSLGIRSLLRGKVRAKALKIERDSKMSVCLELSERE